MAPRAAIYLRATKPRTGYAVRHAHTPGNAPAACSKCANRVLYIARHTTRCPLCGWCSHQVASPAELLVAPLPDVSDDVSGDDEDATAPNVSLPSHYVSTTE